MQAIDDFLIEHDGQLFFQPCVSPTWDTALAAQGAARLGDRPATTRRCVRAAEWLIDEPDLRARRLERPQPATSSRAAGRSSSPTTGIPTSTTRAVILMVLQRIAVAGRAARAAARSRAALNWTLGMQSRNGGWGAFDTDNDARVPQPHPVRRHGGDDRPADRGPDRAPARADGRPRLRPRLSAAPGARSTFLLPHAARRRLVVGTLGRQLHLRHVVGAAPACAPIGEDLDAPYVRRAVAWLSAHQNADGGWGETLASYDDETLAGRGESHAVADRVGAARPARRRATRRQRRRRARRRASARARSAPTAAGTSTQFTGTGFPRHFYLRY